MLKSNLNLFSYLYRVFMKKVVQMPPVCLLGGIIPGFVVKGCKSCTVELTQGKKGRKRRLKWDRTGSCFKKSTSVSLQTKVAVYKLFSCQLFCNQFIHFRFWCTESGILSAFLSFFMLFFTFSAYYLVLFSCPLFSGNVMNRSGQTTGRKKFCLLLLLLLLVQF